MWKVEYTDEFHAWWEILGGGERDAVLYSVGLLEQVGPALGRPHVDTVAGSRFPNMKELRSQYRGRPYRVFFAPKRYSADRRRQDRKGEVLHEDDSSGRQVVCGAPGRTEERRVMLMAGHHPISSIRAAIPPARRRKIDAKVKAELTCLMLAELRKAENLSQRDLAARLGVSQPAVAKMESQDDVQLSTLQRLVAALGGNLEVIARLPSGEYRVGSFRAV